MIAHITKTNQTITGKTLIHPETGDTVQALETELGYYPNWINPLLAELAHLRVENKRLECHLSEIRNTVEALETELENTFLTDQWNKATVEMSTFFEGMDAKIATAQAVVTDAETDAHIEQLEAELAEEKKQRALWKESFEEIFDELTHLRAALEEALIAPDYMTGEIIRAALRGE